MRPRVVAVLAAVVVLALIAGIWVALRPRAEGLASWIGPGNDAEPEATTSPTPPPPPPPPLPRLAAPADPASVTAPNAKLFGWALLDRQTGALAGSANAGSVKNTVESMIKPWIAADYLRRLSESGQQPSEKALTEITLMIVDSNDPMAEKYYQIGGRDAVVNRMISMCGLTDVTIRSTLWSWTEMTPADSARYAVCLGDNRAAGAQWTPWLLETMRNVRGTVADQRSGSVQGGRWGIIDGLPPDLAQQTSIKNGWTLYKDGWHINCLAVHPDWTLAIELRTTRGLQAGADICKAVTERLVIAA